MIIISIREGTLPCLSYISIHPRAECFLEHALQGPPVVCGPVMKVKCVVVQTNVRVISLCLSLICGCFGAVMMKAEPDMLD